MDVKFVGIGPKKVKGLTIHARSLNMVQKDRQELNSTKIGIVVCLTFNGEK